MVTTTQTQRATTIQVLTRKDFVSDQEVRWCPGCGDYSILAQTQRVMPDLGIPRENIVFISGIGCSSRLPYYMNTYGFHSIHGRAPTIATGLKAARPELSVWVITGDGDGLSIGGNHFLHVLRRNVDLQIILHNNEIYGLTKGQYSPTSPLGEGHEVVADGLDRLAAEAAGRRPRRRGDLRRPLARRRPAPHGRDARARRTATRARRSSRSTRTATSSTTAPSRTSPRRTSAPTACSSSKHGKPMIFGKNDDKGIRINGLKPEVVELGKDGITEKDILVHDETIEDPTIAFMLSRMDYPEYPVPVGVIRAVQRAHLQRPDGRADRARPSRRRAKATSTSSSARATSGKSNDRRQIAEQVPVA